MASRQEEKEQRRREREAIEAKANAAARRQRRLQMVGGVILVVAVIAVIGIVIAGSGGDDDSDTAGTSGELASVQIPEPGTNAEAGNLEAAARAADCELTSPREEGNEHTTETVEYESNPPTSGNHNPTPAEDGVYDAGNEPAKENYVHTLEHGRILIQYKPGTPQRVVDQLETLFGEEVNGVEGYKTLLFQNNTNMEPQVAVTAWTQMLACPSMNDEAFDAIRAFRARYVDKGPEFVP
jgi:Protein of unknown function (DUF3105)